MKSSSTANAFRRTKRVNERWQSEKKYKTNKSLSTKMIGAYIAINKQVTTGNSRWMRTRNLFVLHILLLLLFAVLVMEFVGGFCTASSPLTCSNLDIYLEYLFLHFANALKWTPILCWMEREISSQIDPPKNLSMIARRPSLHKKKEYQKFDKRQVSAVRVAACTLFIYLIFCLLLVSLLFAVATISNSVVLYCFGVKAAIHSDQTTRRRWRQRPSKFQFALLHP